MLDLQARIEECLALLAAEELLLRVARRGRDVALGHERLAPVDPGPADRAGGHHALPGKCWTAGLIRGRAAQGKGCSGEGWLGRSRRRYGEAVSSHVELPLHGSPIKVCVLPRD